MSDWLIHTWSLISNFLSIAAVGAIAGAAVSYSIAGRNVYINSITAERSKWIDKLRNNIALYSACVAQTALRLNAYNRKAGSLAAVLEKLEEQNELAALVQLQLNPWGEIDRNILGIIGTIAVRSTTEISLLQQADDLLIEHSQWLLKAEWEKVKFEARGPFFRILHRNDEMRRLDHYKSWVKGPGAIDALKRSFDKERKKPPLA